MSHRIETHDKQQGLTMAWHGLTEINPELSLSNNWLATWDIQATPLSTVAYTDDDYVDLIRETQFKILTATDNPEIQIGVPFSDSYRPVTNKEFLQLMKDVTEGTKSKLMSVGSVRNRGRVFATFENEQLESYTAGGRTFNPYLNFGNGHDKSSVLWANTSNVATVCDNTFSMNLAKAEQKVTDSVKQRHTKNVMVRLPEMGLILRNAVVLQKEFAIAFEALSETKISAASAERIFTGFVAFETKEKLSTRATNIIANLMKLFRRGRGNKGETLADLFSAVTEHYTHFNAGNGTNPNRQFASSEFGNGSQRKHEFFGLVTSQSERENFEKLGAEIQKLK